MEIIIRKPHILIFFAALIFLAGCSADGGKVTARDVLKRNEDADVLKYNGFMYNNVTDLEWFEEMKSNLQKGKEIGKIKKVTTSSLFFTNLSATKLPKGTILYDTDDGKTGVIIVETEDEEILYYLQLLEG
ncbi:hypothetical protein [Bacillus sp. ISL-55]|uniref:hypothetical protein n=1 Tax=Bacillus sp. ISL-55 TaxID=2819134 RepID=UPI001BE94742|nr:hypothetical protein [Bacillus sp. ISL-55]MBT2691724.1 hypothetical protein [Bacillus sp. ISL-55]